MVTLGMIQQGLREKLWAGKELPAADLGFDPRLTIRWPAGPENDLIIHGDSQPQSTHAWLGIYSARGELALPE